MTMRTSTITLLVCPVLLAAASCVDLGDGLSAGRSRSDCSDRAQNGGDPGAGDGDGASKTVTDTTLYFSAVRFADSYDWRRDSTYGAIEYEILFYRDFEPVLSVPSAAECASPDLDSHHIIGGRLYTEAVSHGRTVLGRDGQTLFSFEGKEILRGLLPVGDDIYTLSESRGGEGFSLRKNGEIVFRRESGSVFGDLADPSYRPYGALYRDLDKICFCYRSGKAPDEYYYMVQDGVETRTSLQWRYWIEDVKVCQGYPRDAEVSCLWYLLEDGRVWIEDDGRVSTSGWMSYGGDAGISAVVTEDDPETLVELCEGPALVLHGRDRDFAVREEDSGGIRVFASGTPGTVFDGPDWMLMSPSCTALVGDGEFCAALTSRSGDAHQVLYAGGQTDLSLHGYLSCIRAELTERQTN